MSHVTNPPVINNNTYIFLNLPFNPQQTDEINKTIEDAAELAKRVNDHASKINTNITEPKPIPEERSWKRWTKEETDFLMQHIDENLEEIVVHFPDRTKDQVRVKRNDMRKKLREAEMEKSHDGTHTKKRKERAERKPAEIILLIEPKDKIEFLNNGTPMAIIDETEKVATKVIKDASKREKHRPALKKNSVHWTKEETTCLKQLDEKRLNSILHLFPDKTKVQIKNKRYAMRKKLREGEMEKSYDGTHTKKRQQEEALKQEEKNPQMEPGGNKISDRRMRIDFLNDDVRPLSNSQNQGQNNPLEKPRGYEHWVYN